MRGSDFARAALLLAGFATGFLVVTDFVAFLKSGLAVLLLASVFLGIGRERCGKKFDSNVPAQPRVSGPVYLAHTACSQMADDLVMCEFGTDHSVVKYRANSIKASLNHSKIQK
jgi:hypothetical protein